MENCFEYTFLIYLIFLTAGKNLLYRISEAGKHISWFREEVDGFRIYVGKQGICNTASIRRHAKTHTHARAHTQTFEVLSCSGGTFSHPSPFGTKMKIKKQWSLI